MVEILFSKGFVRLLFATETFAVGINMPTKTVVMTSFRKHSEKGLRMLKPDEYIQMAGRAGRRGLDTSGTVVYIPEREPETLSDVQAMMKGTNQKIESKMDFHYGFLLRSMHSKMNWRDIADNSFWKAQNDEILAGMRRDLNELLEKRDALHNAEMVTHYDERQQLEKRVKETVNAERRQAQQMLEAWKNTHVGPRWEDGWLNYLAVCRMNAEIARELKAIIVTSNYQDEIQKRILWLDTYGFTGIVGFMAANVHTAHMVMAKVFHDHTFHDLPIAQLVGCLAVFVGGKDYPVLYDGQELDNVKPLESVFQLMEHYSRCDTSPESFWALDASLVDIAIRWYSGEDAFVLCRDYEMYEGDFVKAMLKLQKVIDEWVVLAGISDDLDMLEKFRDVSVIRGIVTQDSLYIRL
jgi:superfamily II RNA helicase